MRRPTTMLLLAAAVVAVLAASCSSGDDSASTTEALPATTAVGSSTTDVAAVGTPGATSERYEDLALWHCHPDKPEDACDRADLTATVVDADGSATVVDHVPADDPPIDCFYVYPTVNFDAEPGIQGFDRPVNPIEEIVTANTFAPYSEACRLFAPRYEQMTLSGYRADNFEELFSVGDAQIEEAFDHYLATQNDGRPFVLVGHSQGSHHLVRLLQERFDGEDASDAALRGQLLSALLIGPTGWVYAPAGETTGGTFVRLALCTAPDELGCVVAYDSYAASSPPKGTTSSGVPEGMQRACTNPGDLAAGDAPAILSGPNFSKLTAEVTTSTEIWPDFYSATCATDPAGQPYLEIAAAPGAGDQRTEVLLAGYTDPTLHRLDPNLGMRDLLDLLASQTAAHADATG